MMLPLARAAVSDPAGLTPGFFLAHPRAIYSTVILGLACPRTCSEDAEDPAIREGEALGREQHRAAWGRGQANAGWYAR